MFINSWDVMRRGNVDKALWQMRHDFSATWNPSYSMPFLSPIMQLGVAYLWLKNYEAAWGHFRAVNEAYPGQASGTYGMAAVAKWCLNQPRDAVDQWRTGLHCDYADLGEFQTPLLLYFASVVQPQVFPESEAIELLNERLSRPRAQDWPGPLAEFVLGQIKDSELIARCAVRNEEETCYNRWVSGFYVGVAERARGNLARYRDQMRQTGTTSWEEFDKNKNAFLGKLWREEFFLARHEAGLPESNGIDPVS